jgi:hypothetical protein
MKSVLPFIMRKITSLFLSLLIRAIFRHRNKIYPDAALKVKDAQLCIPSSFYTFASDGQFIVKYILKSRTQSPPTRSVVVGVDVSKGEIYVFPLANNEITR